MKTIKWWQKAALFTVGAAAAEKILFINLGWTLTTRAGVALYGVDVADLLRVLFAALSFVAFDLVIVSVVVDMIAARHAGVAWTALIAGIVAGVVAGIVSAAMAIGLTETAPSNWLVAAPAATLLAYAAHLVFTAHAPRHVALPIAPDEPAASNAGVQVTINNQPTIQLPATVAEFLLARADELQISNASQLALACGTSPDTARRALTRRSEFEGEATE